jgi:hypothetical protein
MRLLSWDVGIYNLSYCMLEKNDLTNEIKIVDWDIVNLVDNEAMKKNINLLFENIPRKLNERPHLLNNDVVVIENQPSLKNPKMKSVQMILYSYFVILGKINGNGDKSTSYIDKIEFCSASNKLKVYDGPKIILEEKVSKRKKAIVKVDTIDAIDAINVVDTIDTVDINIEIKSENPSENPSEINKISEKQVKKSNTVKYADKKRLAIEHVKYYLEKPIAKEYKDFFNDHKKKDDLADSFLQGLYFLGKK